MIHEVNGFGIASAGGLALLLLEYTEVSINLSLMKARFVFLYTLTGEFNLVNLNGV